MQMESVLVGAFAVNCLIVWDRPDAAVVVDPGAEVGAIDAVLARHKLTVAAYWLTHGHIDHLSAIQDLLAKRPAPVQMHAADAAWAFTAANSFPPYVRVPARPTSLTPVEDGQLLEVGGLAARVLHTPGHSPGCLCFHFEKEARLITGDTLFEGSIGRTDFRGSDPAAMKRSLACLMALDDAVAIFPGHGSDSTIGRERRHNPFLQDLAKARP